MKILIADRLLKGRPNADWKEGWEFFYAFNELGHQADIAGPDCPIDDKYIPEIADSYDFILITENYWIHKTPTPWKFWYWDKIKTFKIFWAVDTHLVDYTEWVKEAGINLVACNNRIDLNKFQCPSFWLPYGVSERHFGVINNKVKKRDVAFIGSLNTSERRSIVKELRAEHISAYGRNYVREIQASKICVNAPISYDLNAKTLEIMAAGSFLLTRACPFLKMLINSPFLDCMMWLDLEDLSVKIHHFLKNDHYRETLVTLAREEVLKNHTWRNRAQEVLAKFVVCRDTKVPS